MNRAFRYRLYPTPAQEERLLQFAGTARFIYNLALEQRRDFWRQHLAITGRQITWAGQSKEVTDLRSQIAWLANVPRSICEQALRDLDRAFSAFYRKRKGFPRMRARGFSDSFRVQGVEVRITKLNRKWATIQIPRCEPIKFRLTQSIIGKLVNVTVRFGAGVWHVSIIASTIVAPSEPDASEVGIDRGIANTISLSTGEHFQMPVTVALADLRKRRAQRALARCKKGSARRMRQKAITARHSAHVAAARNHWLHERSTEIVGRFGAVTMEALRIKNMTSAGTGKRGLNRSILAQGWGAFAAMIEYKMEMRGGRVEYVNPAYTSQTCAECGSIDRRSRESQAVFRCVDCGHVAHADTNAAVNILRRSPASVEAPGCGAVEARIGTMLTRRENLAV